MLLAGHFLSDLHFEFGEVPTGLPSIGEDVVVLAGDIHTGLDGIRWARQAITDREVLYVMGNHEFYGQNFDVTLENAKRYAEGSNVTLLENTSKVIGGVRFAGATLWTDFRITGAEQQATSLEAAGELMNDFLLIRRGPEGLTHKLLPIETLQFHKQSRTWLEREISGSAQPVVVISHHGPFEGASAEQYHGDILSGAFNSDLIALMVKPVKAWIFGHTHHNVETRIGSALVVSNQRGYRHEKLPGFGWERCIEIFPDHSKLAQPC